ncbi:phage head completion protein [Cytobacillus oceanisediminis]|uniref:phage head completion protein n=1 Tax=Cytobacillus oceanisediminis TaxID=665099 RepID=UPI002079923D|nr:head-tail adaptor protein [Cytobacillus oceanisediminis]USK43726.1 head-tail adaptor protein [Cytobacillus oceanisediminis]
MSKGILNTRVSFYEYVPNDGPEPGEKKSKELYKSWAKVDEVWLKDIEIAKSNGTLSDVTITIRNPGRTYQPNNKHYLSIDSDYYRDKDFNIKHVRPDLKNRGFIQVIAGVSS